MTIPISAISADASTQSRVELNQTTVAEYVAALVDGKVFPPVVAFFDGEVYWLADGFHRIEANKRVGNTEIEADVREGTQRDAILYSLGANETHGLRRTRADKNKAVETALADPEWSQWSDRVIAKRCGVSDKKVASARALLNAEFRVERKFVTRHGSEATRTVTRKPCVSNSNDVDAESRVETGDDLSGALIEAVRSFIDAASHKSLLGLQVWLRSVVDLRGAL